MNILVVNERFSHGGLETHIHSYYMQLREKHCFTFAMSTFESKLEFAPEALYTGFHFSDISSINDFIEDVERLVELIREKHIDVIHAHPFYSFFPAVVAGQLTGVPVVYTHHGTSSFAFPGRVNEAILLYYAYAELVSCVFSVSNTGKLALEERVHVPNVVFMPNAVDTKRYRQHSIADNHRWAAISRLDADVSRVVALEKLFDMLPQLPISGIDVYGDGAQRQELEDYVEQCGLKENVRFMGHCDDLYKRLDGNYNGIAGCDRVALEGLSMGYPVLELGYGRVCGLLHGDILRQAKDCNFVANVLPELSCDAIAAQLEEAYAHPEKFDFRQEIVKDFDIQAIAQAYVERLSALVPTSRANVINWFEEVKAQPNLQENFYASQDILWTMRRHIEPYAIDRNVKELFLLGSDCMDLKNEIRQGSAKQEQAQAQISGLEEARGQYQERLSEQTQRLEQAQAQIFRLEEARSQLQEQLLEHRQALEQAQTQLLGLEEAKGRLQERLLEQAQGLEQAQERLAEQTQLLEQLREQTEYHRKILAPLIWLRRTLSKIKWAIKNWFRKK